MERNERTIEKTSALDIFDRKLDGRSKKDLAHIRLDKT